MKETKMIRKFFPIPHYEVKAIEEYLENMALEGLFFYQRKGAIWYFKKGEPKKLRYYVDIFDKASWFDTRPENETLDYLEYCKNSGWEYIFTDGKYQFFCSEQEDAVAIETDQKQKLKMIHKASIGNCLVVPLILMLNVLLGTASFFRELSSGPNAWIEFSLISVGTYLMFLMVGIIELCIVAGYVTFYLKNRVRIKHGQEIQLSSLAKAQSIQKIYISLLLIGLLFFIILLFMINMTWGLVILGIEILLFGVIWGISFVGQKNARNHSRRYNMGKTFLFTILALAIGYVCMAGVGMVMILGVLRGDNSKVVTYTDAEEVTWYISQDEIPYTLEDIGVVVPERGYRDSSAYKDRMLLCSAVGYYDSYYEDVESEASYEINYTKYEFFNAAVRETWVKNYLAEGDVTVREDIAELWNASNAYILVRTIDGEHYTEIIIEYDSKCYLLSENLIDKTELVDILN